MALVAGVRFKRASKVYDFDTNGLELRPGELVIVEVEKGLGLGTIANTPKEVDPEVLGRELKKVVRKADSVDEERNASNIERENEALRVCRQKIAEYNLQMKLVRVEYLFDSSKAIFYFTSETRVDFRELVKYLASILHTRIEMKQIGVRDEAKMIGGIASCGRELCCAGFLFDLEPVTIKMAKDQNLALNPAKISGICGRLMCCLSYEHGMYKAEKAERAAAAKSAGGGCGCSGAGGGGCGCGHGHHAQSGDALKAEAAPGAGEQPRQEQKKNEARPQRGQERGRGNDRGAGRGRDRGSERSDDRNINRGAEKNNNNRNSAPRDAKDNKGEARDNKGGAKQNNNRAGDRQGRSADNKDRNRGGQRPQHNARNNSAGSIVKVQSAPLASQRNAGGSNAIVQSSSAQPHTAQSGPQPPEAPKARAHDNPPVSIDTPDTPHTADKADKGE